MEDITEILDTMQKGFIDVLTDIELALINKQYDIIIKNSIAIKIMERVSKQ